MFGIQPQELLLILVVALIVVGPKKLPELGRSIGKGLREIRKAQDEVRKTVQVNLDEPERPAAPRRARALPEDVPAEPAAASGPEAVGGATVPPNAVEPSTASEISKTLGRGLGELRRARREVERSFRVDLNEGKIPGADSEAGDTSGEGTRPE